MTMRLTKRIAVIFVVSIIIAACDNGSSNDTNNVSLLPNGQSLENFTPAALTGYYEGSTDNIASKNMFCLGRSNILWEGHPGWLINDCTQCHDLPVVNHNSNITSVADCASCHGEVERQGVIVQKEPMTMGWCLDCHRETEKHVIRTREITGVDVSPYVLGSDIPKGPTNCSACHH